MRVAVIDLGSNSIRLLVADLQGKTSSRVYRDLVTTRLGRGVAVGGCVDSDAMAKTLSVIKSFLDKAQSFDCDAVVAFGTSALREAKNRREFLQRVRLETGLEIEVISGQEEAELSYIGAREGLGLSGSVLVVDIGGGSTEFSLGDEGDFFFESVPLGAVRWTQNYIKQDPLKPSEISMATEKARELLSPVAECIGARVGGRGRVAVGVGGTWTTMAAVSRGMKVYDPDRIHGLCLGYGEVMEIHNKLLASNLEERQQIPGLPALRADIIPAGSIIAVTAMETLGLDSIRISETDLQEGFIIKKFFGK